MWWRTFFSGEVGFIPAPVDPCSPHSQCPMRVLRPADTCKVSEGVELPLAMLHQPKPLKSQKVNTTEFLSSSEPAAGPDNSSAALLQVWLSSLVASPSSHTASRLSQEEAGGLHTTCKRHTVTSDHIAHWPELALWPCLVQVELGDVGMGMGT